MMQRSMFTIAVITLIMAAVGIAQMQEKGDQWSIKANVIESCSCDLFCPCFFNTHPDKDFCKFDNAYVIEKGHYGTTKLDGVKMWLSGDLGSDFTKGIKEVYFTFEPSATQEQVDGVVKIFSNIFGGKPNTTAIDRAKITWEKKGAMAHATLGEGQGEITLDGIKGNDGAKTVVVNNLAYFGAKKNSGFTLAKSKHHYKGHNLDYAYEDANGFTTTIESSGK